MTITLIHVYQIKNVYLCYGVKCQSGTIWGHWGQKVILTKNAITCPCCIVWSYLVNLTYSLASDPLSHLRDQQATWGQSGVQVSKPAGYAVSDNMSSFFFLCGNMSFSHTSLHPIFTKLGQSDRYLDHYSGTDNGGVRGYDGVTGVKKVIFTKKASSPTECLASMRDLCICISLTPATKVMVLKNSSGVIWGHGGQKVIFTKKASSPSEYVALTRYLCTCISLIPSTKVMVLKFHPGSFGVTGVKR